MNINNFKIGTRLSFYFWHCSDSHDCLIRGGNLQSLAYEKNVGYISENTRNIEFASTVRNEIHP